MAYRAVTRGILVSVNPPFIPEQSGEGRWVWAYTIEIRNTGGETVQLLSRHWRITDAKGVTQEVKGPGVVGEQPTLRPGESFEYTSGVPLEAPSGMMVGTYEMQTRAGEVFQVEVPAFSLDSPSAQRVTH